MTATAPEPLPDRARAVWNREPLAHVRRVIAIGSGKGGVGKSTVAINLAFALQQLGQRVGVLDADIYGPSIPRLLGMLQAPAPAHRDGAMQPAMAQGIASMAISYLVREQAAILRGPMISKTLHQFLRGVAWGTAETPLDFLLIDLPPGTGDVPLSLAQAAPIDGALLVTTPQQLAVADADKAAQMFAKLHIPLLGVVENMSFFTDPTGTNHPLFGQGGGFHLAHAHGTKLAAQLPLDPAIGQAGELGENYLSQHAGSTITLAFMQLAASLITALSS